MKHNASGFTLVELVIAVAIVGILAAVAYPAYIEHSRAGQRADAQAALMNGTVLMEKYFTENNTFVGATVPDTAQKYDITVKATATTYTITATPTGSQASDACGTLSVDSNGDQTADGTDCW